MSAALCWFSLAVIAFAMISKYYARQYLNVFSYVLFTQTKLSLSKHSAGLIIRWSSSVNVLVSE